MIGAAIDLGLDALVISDHDSLVPPGRLDYFNRKYAPFRVFGGIEITARGEHLLVLGVSDPALERKRWSYPDLHAFVEEREGFLAVAHPFRFNPDELKVDVERFRPHALEAYSRNTPESAESRILALARELGVPVISNSDAHHARDIGAYHNLFDDEPQDVHALVRMLKAGAFEPVAPTRMPAPS
jgi:predicted metal-dependent phosphoesterase TrpH